MVGEWCADPRGGLRGATAMAAGWPRIRPCDHHRRNRSAFERDRADTVGRAPPPAEAVIGRPLNPFEYRGDALATAYAHGDERVAGLGPMQFVDRLDGDDGARGTDRVAEGDGATVRVDLFRRKAEVARDRASLGGESLIGFDHVDIGDAQ